VLKSDAKTIGKTMVAASKPKKQRILICQKSNCWRQGGNRIFDTIQSTLRDRGLTETVEVQLTGCLKECKYAPNVVMMPDKIRYRNVQPKSIELMVEKHFTGSLSDLNS
jgi:(2Fe-2S) ferredoxin